MIPAIAVVGPTGSGKTGLAVALARELDTEIISADSMQFYRGMEIGTAAPTAEEQAAVRHHFVSVLHPDEAMAAGQFQERARVVLHELNARGMTAVVAGGSGLYVNALLDGLFDGPAAAPEIRERLQREAGEVGNAAMMARLRGVDPDYAATLTSENDLVRIVRALEVYEATGEPFSKLHRAHQASASPIAARHFAIDWPRAELYERINQRVNQMIAAGWVAEVEALVAAGYAEHLHRLKALGYREILAHLAGEQPLDEAIEKTKMHHRRYAKRQLTWFRADPRIVWLAPEDAAMGAGAILGRLG